jgi:hypothetical protein
MTRWERQTYTDADVTRLCVKCADTPQSIRWCNMNKAQVSLFVFGLYMVCVVGLGFMLIPLFILNLFGLSAGDDVWIRVVGMLASIVGGYYILAVRARLDRFIPWTVAMRYYAAAFMVLLVVLGKVGPALLLFAAVDAGAATWTWFALRSSK